MSKRICVCLAALSLSVGCASTHARDEAAASTDPKCATSSQHPDCMAHGPTPSGAASASAMGHGMKGGGIMMGTGGMMGSGMMGSGGMTGGCMMGGGGTVGGMMGKMKPHDPAKPAEPGADCPMIAHHPPSAAVAPSAAGKP